MKCSHIPEGCHSVTPYLVVDDANAAIDFYTRALGAQEKFRMKMPAPSGVEGATGSAMPN